MKSQWTRMLTVLLVLIAAQPAWAKRLAVHEAAESQDYGRKAGGMLGRGLLNAGTCFVDLLVNTVNETKNGPPLVGTLTGISKGVGCSVLRAASGVVDVATFWVPAFNGIPVSDSYENCFAASATSVSSITPEPAAGQGSTAEAPSEPEFSQQPQSSASSGETGLTTTGTTVVRPRRVWKK